MITELILKDWKSFANATLYIDPLTILIGANASGKSNLLDALLFLQRIASGVSIFSAINGDVGLEPLRGGMEWVARKPKKEFTLEVKVEGEAGKYRYSIDVEVNGKQAQVCYEELVFSDTHFLYHTIPPHPEIPTITVCISPSSSEDVGTTWRLNPSIAILNQMESATQYGGIMFGVKAVLTALRSIFVFNPIPSHMRNYTPLSEQLLPDGANIAGVLAGLPDERKAEIEETLTRYLRELPEKDIRRVWTESVGKFKTDAMLYCEEGWETEGEPQVVDARGMSDGTLRYLAIVTAMLTRPPGSLLVIEEVDNGLHPSRAHLLVRMLRELGKARGIDVIATTHTPSLLDAAGPELIPFITVAHRDPETGESRLTPLEDLKQLPKLMAGGSLGRLTTEGRIEAALKQEGAA